ncbi:MAG: nitroreductase family protein [Deltaproteobacteria bacterium]|nr:nitroreductase family protein [Deltaproteobacteria bacterium]MBW2138976.1 nitroreductase family protein [Deltaproteobacteria bacterium]
MDTEQQVFSVIKDRRSIRKYKPDPVPQEKIELLIEAARWAPSGENAQPWRFVIIKDRNKIRSIGKIAGTADRRQFSAEFAAGETEERLKKIKDPKKRQKIMEKLTAGYVSSFLENAPLIIIVCGRKDVWDLPYDCSAAIENILIMAAAAGLGTCWVESPVMDVRDEEKIKEMLRIPRNYKVLTAISVGVPDESPKPRPRLPLEDLVFYESFGRKEKDE